MMTMKDDAWVWVLVRDPEGDAAFLGLEDRKGTESIIPAYMNKKAADRGFEGLGSAAGAEVEIQAIRYGDLRRRARESGFAVGVIDDDGNLVEKKDA